MSLNIQNSKRLMIDYRLGGQPNYYLGRPSDRLMRVPEEFRKSVVFLASDKNGEKRFVGTAFFVRIPSELPELSFNYLVTAKHIIEGMRINGYEHIYIRTNLRDGTAAFTEASLADWRVHPDQSEIEADVAVMYWPPGGESDNLDFMSIPIKSAATKELIESENIGHGDEVCIIGLFTRHSGTARNIPIVRIGNIAALSSEERVRTQSYNLIDAHLVEVKSIGGLSGSPVLVNISGFRPPDHKRPDFGLRVDIFFWLGLVHGHWDEKISSDAFTQDLFDSEKVNLGIAAVVPVDTILEVLYQDDLENERKNIMSAIMQARGPTPDTTTPPSSPTP